MAGLIAELGTLLNEATTEFQKWIRPVLVGAFGEEHGNFLADIVKVYTDIQVGPASSLISSVAGIAALATFAIQECT